MKTHLRCILNPEMAKPAQTQYSDGVARPCAGVSQRVECGEPGAHEGRRIDGRKLGRHQRDRAGGCDHVLRVATVVSDAGDLMRHASEELTAAARVAASAITAVPTNTHLLARLPADGAGSHRIDHSGHLMPRYTRMSFLGDRIAVADSTSLHTDAYRSGARLGYRPLNNFERPVGTRDLHRAHCRHASSASFNHVVSPAESLHSPPAVEHRLAYVWFRSFLI